jgi:UDP-N-acetylglucosamine--N-acetylmuramyl-(pentapeptide) pyrophosphoryl-undecaprenol N-acetylglucosamine transferase
MKIAWFCWDYTMSNVKKILMMAGGTGGHVFPGLAVAHHLRDQGVSVYWLGTRQGIESTLVPKAGFPIYFIDISGLRGKRMGSLLTAPWQLLRAVFQAIKIIRDIQPDVVLGMGGFVSGPGGIATWFLRKKLIIHEQNAKSGLTNRWLSKIAMRVLEGFPNTFAKRQSVVTTGNPVRKEMTLIPSPAERMLARQESLQTTLTGALQQETSAPRLLVLGGSLGAQAINELLPRTLAQMPLEARPLVYHQAGEKHVDKTIHGYAQADVVATVVPFITEIDKAYAWADFVICRAGALTIAELCAAGVGAILIPFPYAVDDHQTANADYMVNHDAAIMVQQAALSEDLLKKMLHELCFSADKRMRMAEAAYQLRQIDAVEKVCKEVCQ